MTWIFLGLAVGLSAAAQVLFKAALTSAHPGPAGSASGALSGLVSMLLLPGVLAGLAAYGVSTVLWLMALKRLELSLAYPFVAVGIVLTSAAGTVLFQEAMPVGRVAGIVLICLGVVLVGRSAV